MLETLQNLGLGFQVALAPGVLWYGFIGCLVGTLVGMLPGLGPLAGISLLLPATFGLTPTTAIVLLAGIYYGAMYGGSTTSILMRIPGEAASVMTCIDGYAMTQKGRAGAALAIAAFSSFFAGTVSLVALTLVAPPLASIALKFGPPEYFGLLTMGLLVLAYMSGGSMPKTLAMAALGLFLGTIGIDQMSGFFRFQYGIIELGDGIGVVPVAVGLLGLSEVLLVAGSGAPSGITTPRLSELLPSPAEARQSIGPTARGTVLGFLIGLVPGSAHIISSFVSYGVERRISRTPDEFGKGAVAGVAGPEAANNASAAGMFVPLLALGLPVTATAAVIIAAMRTYGIQPGPTLMADQPELVWTLLASLLIGNTLLLVINLPLAPLWARLLQIPRPQLYAGILFFASLGAYSVNQDPFDLLLLLLFGGIGFAIRRFGIPVLPLILGVILGPLMEQKMREALDLSNGDISGLFNEIPAVGLYVLIVIIIVAPYFVGLVRSRRRVSA